MSQNETHLAKDTASLKTDVLLLLAQGCETAFQLVLGKRTSAMNSLSGFERLICLGVEIAAHCDYLFKSRLQIFLLTYLRYSFLYLH